jgi:UDP-N-acetylmuramoyl-L-alanyl-D-glutamate--2,6-diaminopimelate ligase
MTRPSLSLDSITEALGASELVEEVHGWDDVEISGVSQDSRTVEPGDLFLAWCGAEWDAHDFVASAAAAGAAAVVVERHVPDVALPQVRVSDGRRAAALAADTVFGSPWRDLFTVGVTGTNGKTTTALITRHLLNAEGSAVALGTLGLVEPGGNVREGTEGLTTPGPVSMSRWLHDLASEGVTSVVLEASSHALDQKRLDGVQVDVAVFTNLTRDHLDYHGDMTSYLEAKSHLLNLLKDDGLVVVNAGDAHWTSLPIEGRQSMTYGVDVPADLRAEAIETRPHGTKCRLATEFEDADLELPLLGRFNVENALAAASVGRASGMSLEKIARRLASVPQVPGRLEIVVSEPFSVLIDFAHTPDALRRVLSMLRSVVSGRLIVLFGAGGDRDPVKRAEMGAEVARAADVAVVTSDNPRTEDPDTIIDGIVMGMTGFSYERVTDRREAIRHALSQAEPGDLVLLAGKGHELYQVIGTERHPFDERQVVRDSLAALGVSP